MPPKGAKPVAAPKLPRVPKRGARPGRGGPVRRLIDAATGAKLCYGEPVRVGDRVVVPVARVRATGGWGFGRGGGAGGDEGVGHGGGGTIEARPAGFIELGPDGARYEAIPDPDQLGRTLRAGAAALVSVAAVGGRRRAAGLLPRGRG